MTPRGYLDFLKILHGVYNTLMMFFFFYQGWLGLKIRRVRTTGRERDFAVIRRHRKAGPIFAFLGILGFLAGLALVVIDKGRFIEYPLHFTLGLCLASIITTVYILSKKIKGPDSPLRTPHFILGIVLISLYLVQFFVGLSVLF